jgi:hypothetical protein
LSLITTIFTDDAERRRALSVFAAVGSAAFAVGVILGGALTATLGWRWVLFVNVPIGAVALALGPRWLPERRDPHARRLDVPGATTVTAGFLALISGLARAETAGWTEPLTIALLAAAPALLTAFVLIERRATDPLVPLRMFRLRVPTGANAVMFLASAAFFPMFLLVSQYLQRVLGLTAFEAGVAFVPMALTVTVCSGYVSARLTAKVGARLVVTAGMVTMGAGLFLLTLGSAPGSFPLDVLPGTLVVAVGIGTSFTAIILAATGQVPDADQGAASGSSTPRSRPEAPRGGRALRPGLVGARRGRRLAVGPAWGLPHGLRRGDRGRPRRRPRRVADAAGSVGSPEVRTGGGVNRRGRSAPPQHRRARARPSAPPSPAPAAR